MNLRMIENRARIDFSHRKKENKLGHGTATVRRWRTQRRVRSRDTSSLDGLSVKVDNLPSVEHLVLLGELLLIEAFLPELLESLVNFLEEEE